MSNREVFSQLSPIALGGTGCNVIAHMLTSDYVDGVLKQQDLKLNVLAIDVADGDINALKEAYNSLVKKLQETGVSQDRVFLRALTIKFNTPDVLFDFLQNYPKYLKSKDPNQLAHYKPWIDSKLKIPNLAGGVGRMRSLAKAIYALNYYHFSQLENAIEEFQNRVSGSTIQPILVMMFGLGGGTGSGIAYELASHIRQKVGSGIPIVGLSVLPSNSDDSLAKGPSAYMALNEFKEIFDTNKNSENPFTIMFFVPLQLAVTETKVGTLVHAKEQVDEELSSVMKVLSSFDLADLLADIGANKNLRDRYLNIIGFLKVRYPIKDYVSASNIYLDRLGAQGEVLKEKTKFFESVAQYLGSLYSMTSEAYRTYLASLGKPTDDLDSSVEEIVKVSGKYDADVSQIIRTLERYFSEDFIRIYDPLIRSMKFPEESVEFSTLSRISSALKYVQNMSSPEFEETSVESANKEIQNAIRQSRFKSRQFDVLEQVSAFLNYAVVATRTFKLYYKVRYFLSEFSYRLAPSDAQSSQELRRVVDEDLVSLLRYMSTVISKPEDEKRYIAQYAGAFRQVRSKAEDKTNGIRLEMEQIQEQVKRRAYEEDNIKKDLARVGVFGSVVGGKKKRLQRELREVQDAEDRDKAELNKKQAELASWEEMVSKLDSILGYAEVTGNLWKSLNRLIRLTQEYNAIISNAVKSSYYFEKVLDLSEEERLRIIALILSGIDQSALSEADTIKEVVDLPRLKNNLKGLMRLFGSPSYFGLTPSYRTDSVWAIVSAPEVWDNELEEELKNQLAQYSSVSANLGLNVKPIKPVEAWTIEFMVVLSKARPEDLDIYESIRENALTYPPEELRQFKAYKVEEG